MKNNDILKNFALRAKNKLLGKDTKNSAITKVKTISFRDDAFKEKVEYLMDRDDEIFNPMHFLMDDKVLKNLDSEQRERYLLTTIDKYIKYKNEITMERSC